MANAVVVDVAADGGGVFWIFYIKISLVEEGST